MFAGAGRIARMARQAGQKAVALDIVYSSHSHCFDINEDAGFALAAKSLLDGDYGEVMGTYGVCCSSWVATSRGSTKRSFLTPMGCTEYQSVLLANKMVSRLVLLILINVAMLGTYWIEQPSSTLIMLHERMVWLLDLLERLNMRMFRQLFWMRALQHPTPKRTILFSNSRWISLFSFAARMKKHQLRSQIETTDTYFNKEGKKRFKGNASLKKTQTLV
ncbi:unnamed protein product [Cladocopium goreaui]|uniref:Uncharacterized protein n=1 Tax=Cladocopium goreaui TaxID=2562237 RepID=A0A9P1DKR3_9DINO|nr:unnamed protein product [Cladocopium goreaui]